MRRLPPIAHPRTLQWIALLALCSPLVMMFRPLPWMLVQHIPPLRPLEGAVELAPRPQPSLQGWLSGQLQGQTERYLNDHIGLRPFMVRVHNQIEYSFYGRIHARSVVEGSEGYFYELGYIEARNGDDFVGDSIIDNNTLLIKQIQDSLQRHGVPMFFCFAPGKARLLPQYAPQKLLHTPTRTNYEAYRSAFEQHGVQHIDLSAWLLDMQQADTCNCPIYPKHGTHWSHNAMLMAADSLIGYAEHLLGQPLPRIKRGPVHRSRWPRRTDNDIGVALNLLFLPPAEVLCYPSVTFEPQVAHRPNVLVIADSYFKEMYHLGVLDSVYGPGSEFWFYGAWQLFGHRDDGRTDLAGVGPKEYLQELLCRDLIIVLNTDAKLPDIGFDFYQRSARAFGINAD